MFHSPSSPVCQGCTHPAQNMARTLKSDRGSLRISATAQDSVEPLSSPKGTLGYSPSVPSAKKPSTATQGYLVSDDSPLELSISAQLNPLQSSLSRFGFPFLRRDFSSLYPYKGTFYFMPGTK